MSGYGLTRQYFIKGNEYIGTIPSKIVKLSLPYFFCCLLFLCLEHIFIGKITFHEALIQIKQGHFSYFLTFSWFVTAIIYFYVNFYIAFKCKYKEVWIWLGFIFWYLYVNYILPGNNGFMWGPSASFALSVTYALHQERFNKYCVILIFLIVLFGPLDSIKFTMFTLLVLTSLGGIMSRSKILKILGEISYEVYITRGYTDIIGK